MKQVELTSQILNLYVGEKCTLIGVSREWEEHINHLHINFHGEGFGVIPHLRRISSITEEEAREFLALSGDIPFERLSISDFYKNEQEWFLGLVAIKQRGAPAYTPAEFLYLTSKGFDLFGLIEAGLAKEVSE